MKNDLANLDTKINDLKETLYLLIKNGSLTDETVVKCSEKLDKLILEYQKRDTVG